MIAKRYRPRGGFTVVELLVAMALIILVMAVLSEAFVAGLSAFRSLKGIGDMQERLRVVALQLRRDLSLPHFEGSRKLSDVDPYWQDPFIGNGNQGQYIPGPLIGGRPEQGFFRIQTPAPVGSAPGTTGLVLEGLDGDGLPSSIINPAFALQVNQALLPVLHFTSKLAVERKDALRRDQLFTIPIGDPNSLLWANEGPPDFRSPGLFNSPWAEIAWFLAPNGETAGSTPLYSLYRRQRLMIAPRGDTFYGAGGPGYVLATLIGQYYGVSCEPDPSVPLPPQGQILLFNTEYSVAAQPYPGRPATRSMSTYIDTPPFGSPQTPVWWSTPVPVGTNGVEPANLRGDDLVATDVISFEIKILRPFDTDFRDLNDPFPPGPTPRYFGVYDTAIGNQSFLSLRAIKVTIRVWDFKTQQARQVSIIQDL